MSDEFKENSLPDETLVGDDQKHSKAQRDDIDNNIEDTHQNGEEMAENKNTERSALNSEDTSLIVDIPSTSKLGSGKKKSNKCAECDASYKSKNGLNVHISSKHEGICYSCKYCAYKARTRRKIYSEKTRKRYH